MDVKYTGNYLSYVVDREYEFVHEGDVSIVLPYYTTPDGIRMFGIRREVCPSYESKMSVPLPVYTVIGGRIDDTDDNALFAMIRELYEESGYAVAGYQVKRYIRNLPLCKSTDVRINAFILEMTNYTVSTPKGDGTVWEDMSSTEWHDAEWMDALFAPDNLCRPYDMLIHYLYALSKTL